VLTFSSLTYADEVCDAETVSQLDLTDFSLTIPHIEVNHQAYSAHLIYQGKAGGVVRWKVQTVQPVSPLASGCTAKAQNAGNQVVLNQVKTASNKTYSANMQLVNQTDGLYLELINYTPFNPTNNSTNTAPQAFSISQQANRSILYQVIDLTATDADGDSLTYELVSPTSGNGYSNAYINPISGKLYVTLGDNIRYPVILEYRVTDGIVFSGNAQVTLTAPDQTDKHGLGMDTIDPATYAGFNFSSPHSAVFGAPAAAPSLPTHIDLSANFPVPGNQGTQSSCVGWATAYALKSYQEKVEMDWALNTPEHLFSPSFIYNQIKQPGGGSLPNEALDLAVHSGVATLATMPYINSDDQSQPSAEAIAEAGHYKASSWAALGTVQDIKATLANRNPVVIGITVYPQLQQLQGVNSVYNNYSGSSLGGHAITIVGYDDERFGGAFKVINSWGTDWGDNGYFWLPYNNSVIQVSYSLTDADNVAVTNTVTNDNRTVPETDRSAPNLVISQWDMDYDARPGGQGLLRYKVSNQGGTVAPAGAYINLMLSRDAVINSNDTFVVYEPIQFDLKPGEFVFRDNTNAVNFSFPNDIPAGDYYVALWVDDLNIVAESNETDNIGLGSQQLTFNNGLADLVVENWYSELLDSSGSAGLTYSIVNQGASTANSGWDVNLVFSQDAIIGNGDEIYLVYETINSSLSSERRIFRDSSNPLFFNVFSDINGHTVPTGNYYLAFWIDDQDVVPESNEGNNFSLNSKIIPINTLARSHSKPFDQAYNGKILPKNITLKKIHLGRTAEGKVSIQFLDKTGKSSLSLPKQMQSADQAIFPLTQGYKMPDFIDIEK